MSTPRPSEAGVGARCPGCGSVVSDRFQSCRPIGVDVTQPGYRYLADTWGYCLHLGRHIGTDGKPWLAARDAEHEREVAALRERKETYHEQWMLTERDLADSRGKVVALADEWEAAQAYNREHIGQFMRPIPTPTDLRTLLPRDDAAGAGGEA